MYVMKKNILLSLILLACGALYSSSPAQKELNKDRFLMTVKVWSNMAIIDTENYHFYADTNKRGKLKGVTMQQENGEQKTFSLKALKNGVSFANIRPESIERAHAVIEDIQVTADKISKLAEAEVFDREETCETLLELQKSMGQNRMTAEDCAEMMTQTTGEMFKQQAPMFQIQVDELVELIEASDYSRAPVKLKLIKNRRRSKSGQRFTFELTTNAKEEKTQFYIQKFDKRWLPYHISEGSYIGYDNETKQSIDEGKAFVVDIISVDWDNSNSDQLIDSVSYSSPMTGGHATMWNIAGGKEIDAEEAEKEYQESLYSGREEIFSKFRAKILKENGFPKPLKEK
ncbi:hypothetical protein N9N67_07120 [Bacteriovoracaceae bacterium]|nr:hypothetical protein [Bacteriovoracaceae bacterium]